MFFMGWLKISFWIFAFYIFIYIVIRGILAIKRREPYNPYKSKYYGR